jgi:hypothetical protein
MARKSVTSKFQEPKLFFLQTLLSRSCLFNNKIISKSRQHGIEVVVYVFTPPCGYLTLLLPTIGMINIRWKNISDMVGENTVMQRHVAQLRTLRNQFLISKSLLEISTILDYRIS